MNRIRLLPEQVANQIAAGEVIERPASVVKELVENSLDAQAQRILVEVQGGGRTLVRVSDDGLGMSRDDALLCLERHATSKIQRAEDLAAIATMGFRGEALPSIASVSRFTLTTRERGSGSPEGTQVVINGGKMLEVKSAGCAPGTTVEVRQLFSNLPARRKFLRSEETEWAHIQHYLTLAALAYPEVAFTCQREGRMIWQLPAVKRGAGPGARLPALRERWRAIHGGEQKLLAVDFATELPDETEPDASQVTFRLWGLIGAPGISRATREDQHLFVNRRPVENRGLNFALLEGYHTSLMKGRYPVCCLFLEIDPAAVDVNIHPAKREVKFRQEREVRRLVAQAVRGTLVEYHQNTASTAGAASTAPAATYIGGLPDGRAFSSDKAGQGTELSPHSPSLIMRPAPAAPSGQDAPQTSGVLPNFPNALVPGLAPSPERPPETPPLGLGFAPTGQAIELKPPEGEASGQADSSAGALVSPDTAGVPVAEPVPLLKVPLRLVGVVGRLYVVLESDRGLVLLDQHAAHERILFEQMLNRLEQSGQAASQKLLLPETVELSARDANFLRGQLPVLARLGVGLNEFGERTFLLDALPPFVKSPDARRFVIELVDELKAAGQEINSLRLGEHTVAKTVCRHAVKANDPLSGLELEKLVADLRQCAMPYTCPHGRPTLIEMNFRELERKFGRSQ